MVRAGPAYAVVIGLAAATWSACGPGGRAAATSPPAERSADGEPRSGAAGPAFAETPTGAPVDDAPHPCDPIGSQRPVAGPPHPPAVCGNGVIDTVWGECIESCTGGCGTPITCHVECQSAPESCDGAATTYSCVSQGYAGGTMRCTPDCNLDLVSCAAAAPGAGVRTGSVTLPGDRAIVISDGTRAAVFALDYASTALTGATVTAALRSKRLRGLPVRTLAVDAIGDRLMFVTDDKQLGTIDLHGAVTMHGSVGDANSPALILPEVGHPGSGAVLLGDYQRRVLTVFTPPGAPAPTSVRMFASDNLRVLVVAGTHPLAAAAHTGGAPLVVMRWNETLTFTQAGDHLEPLGTTPAGFAFAETPTAIDDTITWSGGGVRFQRPRAWAVYQQPPGGLSRAAVAGAGMVTAFGGTLFAHADGAGARRRVQLFWLALPDPLAPTISAP